MPLTAHVTAGIAKAALRQPKTVEVYALACDTALYLRVGWLYFLFLACFSSCINPPLCSWPFASTNRSSRINSQIDWNERRRRTGKKGTKQRRPRMELFQSVSCPYSSCALHANTTYCKVSMCVELSIVAPELLQRISFKVDSSERGAGYLLGLQPKGWTCCSRLD